jgi:hypothetical protein
MLEDAQVLPIKTSPHEGQLRLLTTAIDVKTGGGVIFDSYSKSTTYGKEPDEIVIEHPNGLTTEHIMASAAIPANTNYAIIKDRQSNERMFWDGAFASNTPLRGLIQLHRDYWHKIMREPVPDLEEVYIIGLWPLKMDKIPVPPDNNFVWSRMWDLIFEDKKPQTLQHSDYRQSEDRNNSMFSPTNIHIAPSQSSYHSTLHMELSEQTLPSFSE